MSLIQADKLEIKVIREKELSEEISGDKYRSIIEKQYGFPSLDHHFRIFVDSVDIELHDFLPKDHPGFDPK